MSTRAARLRKPLNANSIIQQSVNPTTFHNAIRFAILIYELVGPMLTKLALIDAGEIQPMSDDVKNRRQINLENAKKK